ncbi:MAG TPA: phosphoribosylglycinamide synthetase C domain-containing protein, partial [Candidatus Limnocylindrales bacterium]|nr:phosphoribosylglycinamide synthetase C domain-containing protein [Candidatus Limnocylindrales bacterium]
GTPKRGAAIDGLQAAADAGAVVFHAGSAGRPGGGYGTNGGRVLTVVGRSTDLAGAREAAERSADLISWDGMQRRHDIATSLPAAPALVGAAS